MVKKNMAVGAATGVRCWESGMLLVLPGVERAGCCWFCLRLSVNWIKYFQGEKYHWITSIILLLLLLAAVAARCCCCSLLLLLAAAAARCCSL